MTRAGIYMGWVGSDNLGDEAMYELCKARFPSVRWSSFDQLAYESNVTQAVAREIRDFPRLLRRCAHELRHQPWLRRLLIKRAHELAANLGRQVGLLGGGTLINRAESNLKSYIDVRNRTRSLIPVFGAGVASPEFWSSVPGWKDRRKEWVAVLAELPLVGVRGPLSMELLKEAGARNVVVCGDPAIAYQAGCPTEPSFEPRGQPLRIGINTGDCSGNLWGSQDDIQEALLALTRWLKAANHQIEFIPVWNKDVWNCRELARLSGLAEASVSRALTSPASFLKKVKSFDIVIALKLHAAVLSVAANVPCIVLEYLPKCLDFARSLDWQQFTIRTSQLNGVVLIERVAFLLEQLPAAKERLHKNVCELSQRFDEYCQTIEPMVLGQRIALPKSDLT